MRFLGLALMWFGVLCGAGWAAWWTGSTVGAWRRHWQQARHVLDDSQEAVVLCAGCVGFDHCGGVEGGCDCVCGWSPCTAASILPVTEQVVPYAPVEGHPPWPVREWRARGPVPLPQISCLPPPMLDEDEPWSWSGDEPYGPDWREQTAADLSPEALDHEAEVMPDVAACVSEDDPARHVSSGPGEGKPPGPAQDVMVPRETAPGLATSRQETPGTQAGTVHWPISARPSNISSPEHERLPASLPAIERAFAETMSRLQSDIHGWAAEPWAVRMPWELVAA